MSQSGAASQQATAETVSVMVFSKLGRRSKEISSRNMTWQNSKTFLAFFFENDSISEEDKGMVKSSKDKIQKFHTCTLAFTVTSKCISKSQDFHLLTQPPVQSSSSCRIGSLEIAFCDV